jgi:ABC-2 type transport system permease protein
VASAFVRITRGSALSVSSLYQLLSPRWRSLRNLFVKGDRRGLYIGFAVFGVLFWLGMLAGMHFLVDWMWNIQELGSFIPRKLIELLLVSLFSMLCFSNVIAALSTYFLSDDLELVLALPVSRPTFHFARFLETFGQSSWMLVLFGVPVFLAFGMVIGGGWPYYASLFLGLPAMLSIATNFGVIVATVMVNVYPARRTRELMMIIAMMLVATLFVLMRMLHPEQLVDPEKFQNAAAWVAAVNVPAPILLPSRWVSEMRGGPPPGASTAAGHGRRRHGRRASTARPCSIRW